MTDGSSHSPIKVVCVCWRSLGAALGGEPGRSLAVGSIYVEISVDPFQTEWEPARVLAVGSVYVEFSVDPFQVE